jgi:transcriptional regulator with XRE-family HTH domain
MEEALVKTDRSGAQSELRRRFSEQLRSAILRKGWSQARTVEEARRFLAAHERLGPAHLSLYVNGRALPQVSYLRALSSALDVSEEELLGGRSGRVIEPTQRVPVHSQSAREGSRSENSTSSAQVRDANGAAWLEINEQVPWETALEILRLLKADKGSGG